MDTTTSVAKQLARAYPAYHFMLGASFSWDPHTRTITYEEQGDPALLLHELGHALLGHVDYNKDVQLIAMEREAWTRAATISPAFGVTLEDDTIETSLDTYREWIHARSTCPNCGLTGLQSDSREYRCLSCSAKWRVNEAKGCQLRRYIKK